MTKITDHRPATAEEIRSHFADLACDCRISEDGIVTFRGCGHAYFTKGRPMAAYIFRPAYGGVYLNPNA